MIQVTHLFESHLAVASLDRATAFYRDVLGFTLAAEFPERRVAFFWIGDRSRSMLGLWEAGHSPQRTLPAAGQSPAPSGASRPARATAP